MARPEGNLLMYFMSISFFANMAVPRMLVPIFRFVAYSLMTKLSGLVTSGTKIISSSCRRIKS